MSAKHTPGPWTVLRNNIVAADPHITVANVSNGWIGFEDCPAEVTANARLLATAPELLAALKKTQALLFLRTDETDAEALIAIAQALQAIQKAEGGES